MTRSNQQVQWLACVAAISLSHTACSAQIPAPSNAPEPQNDRHAVIQTQAALSNGLLRSGEYVTEKGWGRLLLKEQGGALTFSIESVTGEDSCGLAGSIRGSQGIANNDDGSSPCTVKFASTPQGIEVAAGTPAECKVFCGYNGGFEGTYLRVKDGCGRNDLHQTREAFKKLYDQKNYKAALATLSPVLTNCQSILEWEEEGGIRNDLAITQYENGLYSECLTTLDEYAEDASKDDDAVTEDWTPGLADRYLAIISAARANIDLCRKGMMQR